MRKAIQTILSIARISTFLLLIFIFFSCDSASVKNNNSTCDLNTIYNGVLKDLINEKQSVFYIPVLTPQKKRKLKSLNDYYSLKPIDYAYSKSLIGSIKLKIDSTILMNDLKKKGIHINISPFKEKMEAVDLDTIFRESNLFLDNITNMSNWLNKGNTERAKSILLFTIPLKIYSKKKEYFLIGLISFYPYAESTKYFYLIKNEDLSILKRLKIPK